MLFQKPFDYRKEYIRWANSAANKDNFLNNLEQKSYSENRNTACGMERSTKRWAY